MAYIEGANAVVPGDPIRLQIDSKVCRGAVVRSASRFAIAIEARGMVIEIDMRPLNEATWERARQFIAEQAGVPLTGAAR